jgi:hypothetical protein
MLLKNVSLLLTNVGKLLTDVGKLLKNVDMLLTNVGARQYTLNLSLFSGMAFNCNTCFLHF